MRYATVCSGIEAPSVAWHPLGWQPAFFSEIEPFPCAVLAHHYPDVPNYGDMTKFKEWPDATLDVLCGGTPCQSFSVAGLRKGLADPRGNRALNFLAIVDRYRPRWVVWENVPGVLSSISHDAPDPCAPPPPLDMEFDGQEVDTEDKYDAEELHALNCFVAGLSELGYGWAMRVLDAQYFGVPQRRRRVFVVGCLGDWRAAAAVLFERHSLSGHPAPSREAREGTAGATARSVAIRGRDGTPQAELGDDKANAILTPNGGRGGVGVGAVLAPEIARCIATREGTSQDWETTAMVAHSLRADGFDASDYGTGRGTPLVPVAFDCKAGGNTSFAVGDVPGALRGEGHGGGHAAIAFSAKDHGADAMLGCSPTLRAGGHTGSHANAGVMPAVAFAQNSRDELREMPYVGALAAEPGMKQTSYVRNAMQVRRLTPTECERLQGFHDGYTLVTYRNKPAADGPRYKALGNSMATPVVRWIGERISMVDQIAVAA